MKEQVDDPEVDMIEHLIASYQEGIEEEVTPQDALDSTSKLISWEEQQEEDSSSILRTLHKLRRKITTK